MNSLKRLDGLLLRLTYGFRSDSCSPTNRVRKSFALLPVDDILILAIYVKSVFGGKSD